MYPDSTQNPGYQHGPTLHRTDERPTSDLGSAARQMPCTFLGKHLRFSPTDLAAIIAAAARPPAGGAPPGDGPHRGTAT